MSEVLTDLEKRTALREWLKRKPDQKRSLARAGRVFELLGGRNLITCPVLGIVGSKGKGTATLAASAIFAANGLRVGTIMSPGVLDSTDRIRIDGSKISDSEFERVLNLVTEQVDAHAAGLPSDGYLSPSGFFMLAGLVAFHEANCDVIVVESGMGGASDEISLLDVDALLLTQVFEEHIGILGDTDVEILREKLGAAGSRTQHVYWLSQPREELNQLLHGDMCQLVDARSVAIEWPTDGQLTSKDGSDWPVDALPAGYQAMNAYAGAETARLLVHTWKLASFTEDDSLESSTIRAALMSLKNPGRLSLHDWRDGKVIVDSAVNRDGLKVAIDFAKKQFAGLPDRLLVCTTVEKDFEGFVELAMASGIPTSFVEMPNTHLTFPDRGEWPGDWVSIDDVADILSTGTSLVVGTVTFSSSVLRRIGVDTQKLFGSVNLTSQ